jgi:glycosyltransferase involved in cell wall biosynthesis
MNAATETQPALQAPPAAQAPEAPLVSVIMPAWNAMSYIHAAIDSVLSQSYRSLELLVINDGSSDGDYSALENIDPRIRVLEGARGGVSRARNLGLERARGRYIAFIDADDLWVPGKLKVQVDYMEAHPDIGIVFAEIHRWRPGPDGVWPDPSAHYPDAEALLRTNPEWRGWMYTRILMGCTLGMITPVMRQEVYGAVGGFDESMERGEDYEYWLRCSRQTRIQGFSSVMAIYRIHAASAMAKIVEPNHLAVLLERARARWGLSDPDGHQLPRLQYHQRLGRAHFDHGYTHYWWGDPAVAAREFAQSFRRGCLVGRSAAFWVLCQVKRLRGDSKPRGPLERH